MEKRKKINKYMIFVFISILLLLFFIVVYTVRFIHYYKEEHPKTNGQTITYFSDILISFLKDSKDEIGLFYDASQEEYYFKGNVENNYISYSGRLWRIISISKDGKIKMATDKPQTLLNYKNDDIFDNSYINEWLNNNEEVENTGIFLKSLYNPSKFLVKTKSCIDDINDTKNITCNETKTDYLVSLFSLYEYDRSGGIDSFLNTSEYLWTTSEKTTGEAWYIFDKGGVNFEKDKGSKYYGIKPTITLKEKLVINRGRGTLKDPFKILDEFDSELSNRFIGEYVSFENYTWRIIDKAENSVKLAMEGFITIDEKELLKPFSTKKSSADVTDKTSILYYLNNTFYKSLKDNNYIVKGSFNKTSIELNEMDYKAISKSNIEMNVGLYSFGEYFISTYKDYYIINNSTISNDLVYSINSLGVFYGQGYAKSMKIRPVIYLDNKILTLGNNGTINSPYILGR